MKNSSQDIKIGKLATPRFSLWTLWIVANGAGTILGVVVFFLLLISFGFLGVREEIQQTNLEIVHEAIVGGLMLFMHFGLLIGFMQWLAVRKYVSKTGFWFLTSTIAMFVGGVLSDVILLFFPSPHLPTFVLWILFGSVSGVLQWIILRKQISNSGIWILINVLSGGIAGISWPDAGIVGGSIGWILTSILSGGALSVLFHNANKVLTTQNAT